MEKEKNKIEIFSFYGGDHTTASYIANKLRESNEFHAVWNEVDVFGPNGPGNYIKYIPK